MAHCFVLTDLFGNNVLSNGASSWDPGNPEEAAQSSILTDQSVTEDTTSDAPTHIMSNNINDVHNGVIPGPSFYAPTVRCKIDNCTQDVPLVKLSIRRHLILKHGYASYQRGINTNCRWENCRCTKTRCGNRGVGHGVHVEDIAEHVWHSHLNFHEACSKCGDARWAYPYARNRHEAKCTGPKCARCTQCFFEFPSVVALEAHIMWAQCAGYSVQP